MEAPNRVGLIAQVIHVGVSRTNATTVFPVAANQSRLYGGLVQ